MEGAFVLWCFCAAERRCSDRCEIIDSEFAYKSSSTIPSSRSPCEKALTQAGGTRHQLGDCLSKMGCDATVHQIPCSTKAE